MQFSHAGKDGLAGLLILMHPEGRVLPLKFFQCTGKSLPVCHTFCLHRQRYYRLGNSEPFKDNSVVVVAECVTGKGVFQTGDGNNFPGYCFRNLFRLWACMRKRRSALSKVPLLLLNSAEPLWRDPGINPEIGKLSAFFGNNFEG